MKQKIVFILSLCFLTFTSSLPAEIGKILIKWNAALCLDTCIPTLSNQFRGIPGVTDFQINPSAGVAELHWAPQYPFSIVPFNNATRMVGIRMSNMRVQVRGFITHDPYNFYIVSLGDNSRFQLIGPIRPQVGNYVIRQNIANHPLAPDVQQKLLQAEGSGQIVTVEGPLFEPTRLNLILITEQITLPPPPAQDFNNAQLRVQ
ncbi:MAG: hypothetical protein H0W88_03795 [Parachlamydiaceae bacterium]|nr:hypothetical protein [Parachlamydiaceae bacterium]